MLPKLNSLGVIIIVMTVVAFSCTDQDSSTNEQVSTEATTGSVDQAARKDVSNPFNETIGAPIDYNKGQEWITNYDKSNGCTTKTYTITSGAISAILNDGRSVGISMMYALDRHRQLHVLPIGVDGKGRQVVTKSVYTKNGNISWRTAQSWIASYTGPVQSHFFGKNTFSRLWSDGVSAIVGTFATDNNNNPQLLLTTLAGNGSKGKVAAGKSFEDASSPCPPVCPK
jgi:hypothetical protein